MRHYQQENSKSCGRRWRRASAGGRPVEGEVEVGLMRLLLVVNALEHLVQQIGTDI